MEIVWSVFCCCREGFDLNEAFRCYYERLTATFNVFLYSLFFCSNILVGSLKTLSFIDISEVSVKKEKADFLSDGRHLNCCQHLSLQMDVSWSITISSSVFIEKNEYS